MQTLAEFLKTFDRASLHSRVEAATAKREELRRLFPSESLATLPLERYGIGQDDTNSLCRLLEFGSDELGSIRGGSSFKFVVYRRKEDGSWVSKLKGEPDPFRAWETIRSDLVQAVQLCKSGNFDDLDKLPAAGKLMAARTKLMHLYFPAEVVPIYGLRQIEHFISALGGTVGRKFRKGGQRRTAAANRELWTKLRSFSELDGWDPIEIMLALYAWSPPSKKKVKDSDEDEADAAPAAELESKKRPALNRILYGPPGTGKTYSVIREAVAICEGSFAEETVRQRFAELSAQGRIRFVTFHQSYAYEDFMEGIRPVLDDDGRAGFELRDGVFKEIAIEAGFACLERPFSGGAKGNRARFDQLWAKLSERLDEEGEIEIDGLVKGVRVKVRRRSVGVLDVVLPSGNVGDCLKSVVAAVYEKLGDRKRINSGEAFRAYGRQSHHNAVAAVFNYLQTLPTPPATNSVPDPTISSSDPEERASIIQDSLERGEASGWRLRAEADRPRHVLIIDEINRGNISRVFGELITLIEDDKRMGAENALTLTLPVSRDLFSVPPNLHLLGTMNTADKSLALLDVALRRRFEFEELAPDFDLCPDLPEEMAEVLDRLNERLERRRDRDHRIGHAFFMGVSDAEGFNEVFRRKVVPLLQEYFFTDVDGARYVLGEEDRKDAAGFLRELEPDGDSKWARQRWRWFTDEEPDFDCWSRLAEALGS